MSCAFHAGLTCMDELVRRGREVIDQNKYMTLATVGPDGLPWATPVFFTPDGYSTLYWASSPTARHSHNVAANPVVSIVVFDSSVAIGSAQAVYMEAETAEVGDDELAERAAFYCRRYPETEDFLDRLTSPDSPFRLYRASVTQHSVLVAGRDPTYGTGVDRRVPVIL
jgi:nitroimidazol reductase NimA-like FMN-containing flavoprotein (pyridoxamine 5'-phosphate oxidase superfamily)